MKTFKIDGGVSTVSIHDQYVHKRYNFKYIVGGCSTFPFFLSEICCLNILKEERHFPKILDIDIILNQKKHFSGVRIKMENLGHPIFRLNGNHMKYFIEILKQVKILHEHHILHGDLKSNNILIDDAGNIHIIDFTHSKIMSDDMTIPYCDSLLQTPTIMAPEVARGDVKLTFKIDIWSLGCVLYDMITGTELFGRCKNDFDMKEELETDDYLDRIERHVESEYERELLKFILREDQDDRPCIDDIMVYIEHSATPTPQLQALTYSRSEFAFDYVDEVMEVILPKNDKSEKTRNTFNLIARCIISALITNDDCYVAETDKYKIENIIDELAYVIRTKDIYDCFAGWY
jgi:serine/threonine protein kinase